ncbi:MAG TPA: pyridoxamine 5'-phosphate oxidase family protein [Acidimicrobiales bacterium]|nr:pyridoxamine 5'-phosphate oxidase family protein [Acidimicrobiales bacterium]
MAKIDRAGFEVLDNEGCYELLAGARLGRVGVTVDDHPAIFPVIFAVVERQVVFATGPGTKLTAAVGGKVVAFEADWVDWANRQAWSVQLVGMSMMIEPGSDLDAAAKAALPTLAPMRSRFLVKIRPTEMSGRRLPPR